MSNNKYQNGKIYRITDNGYHLFYYGSTVQELSCRMSGHRRNYRKYKAGKQSHVRAFDIFDTYGVENCKIELVEAYPCETNDELHRREGYFIQNNECVNKYVAGRNNQEYYLDNKERIDERNKEYYRANIDKEKERRKTYCDNNQEKRKETVKNYYDLHKENINIKITCSVCGVCYVKRCRTQHEKSSRHNEALKHIVEQ